MLILMMMMIAYQSVPAAVPTTSTTIQSRTLEKLNKTAAANDQHSEREREREAQREEEGILLYIVHGVL